jgi:hypothetical protein
LTQNIRVFASQHRHILTKKAQVEGVLDGNETRAGLGLREPEGFRPVGFLCFAWHVADVRVRSARVGDG